MAPKEYDWSMIAQHPKYLALKKRKRSFLFGWWLAASIYYFLLPVLSGYVPDLFKIKLLGAINFGYLFILSQYVMTFFVAAYYTKVANSEFDRMTDELIKELR